MLAPALTQGAVVVAAMSQATVSQAPDAPLSLAAAVSRALEIDPAVLDARSRLGQAVAAAKVAAANAWPGLHLGTSAGQTDNLLAALPQGGSGTVGKASGAVLGTSSSFLSASVDASWTIGDWGQNAKAVQLADWERTIAAEQLRFTRQEALFRVCGDYVKKLSADAATQMASAAAAVAQDRARAMVSRWEKGDADRSQVLQAQEVAVEEQIGVQDALWDGAKASTALALDLGREPDATFSLQSFEPRFPDGPLPAPSALEQRALAQRSDLRAARLWVLHDDLNRELVASDALPKVLLNGTGGFLSFPTSLAPQSLMQGAAPNVGAYVSMDWPLFDGGRLKGQIEAAGLTAARRKAAVEQLIREIKSALCGDRQAIASTRDRLALVKESLDLALKKRQLVSANVQRGSALPLDLGEADLAVAKARTRWMASRWDLQLAWIRLERDLGQPDDVILAGGSFMP